MLRVVVCVNIYNERRFSCTADFLWMLFQIYVFVAFDVYVKTIQLMPLNRSKFLSLSLRRLYDTGNLI